MRVITCHHNDEKDVIDILEDISKRLPHGYSALILPDEDHPAAIIPKDMLPDEVKEGVAMSTPAMFVTALSKVCHDEEFMEEFIRNVLGDGVEELDHGNMH